MVKTCAHLDAIDNEHVLIPRAAVCEKCIKTGSSWVHLRTYQHCGAKLCCDSSPHQHMTQHFHQTRHPVVSSAEPGERWLWCYEDELFAGY